MDNVADGSAVLQPLHACLRRRGSANLLAQAWAPLVDPETVAHDFADHARALDGFGIRHEVKPIPFQPLPYLTTRAVFERTADRFRRLFAILERVIDLYLADPEVRDFFRLQPRYDRLVRLGAPYRPRIQYCRYDYTVDDDGTPRIFELNTHSPAAAAYSERFAALYAGSRTAARLRAHGFEQWPAPIEQPNAFARAMLAAAENAGYLREGRNVAVLNSRYLTMHTELDHIAAQFRALGCVAVRHHVEDLRFDGHRLIAGDLPVQLTFNKFDVNYGVDAYECAFSRTTEEVQPYLDAYRAGAVFAVNSFPSMYLTEQKSTLAFLHSPLLHRHLGREEIALIEEIVPRTTLLRHLSPQQWDEVSAQRDRYVLKRSLDTRGRSVLIGRGVDEAEWHQALAQARAQPAGDDSVVQALSPVERLTTHACGADVATVFTSLACFLFQGEPAGLIVRTAHEETTNVGRQGFMQPAVIVETP